MNGQMVPQGREAADHTTAHLRDALEEIREMCERRLADDRPRFSALFVMAIVDKINTALKDD